MRRNIREILTREDKRTQKKGKEFSHLPFGNQIPRLLSNNKCIEITCVCVCRYINTFSPLTSLAPNYNKEAMEKHTSESVGEPTT
jgi:hypothetical protein